MKLSVITINYNDYKGLQKTLESVFGQSYKNCELIVIDGNSSDASKSYLEKNSSKIDYWISEPDKGIYNAMNKGLLRATGDYVLFLNSGDWFTTNDVISKALNLFTGEDIIYGNLINRYNKDKCIVNKGASGKQLTLKHFFDGSSLAFPATFFKRIIFNNYGNFDETLKVVSDWKFFIETIILNNASVKYIDIEIAYFDMNGISNSSFNLKTNERKQVLQELLPIAIYNDYIELKASENLLNQNRFKMLKELEYSNLSKKVLSVFLRIMLFVFKRKILKDL
ncbi:hypothetical protein BFR04_07230 [Gaetbulibacter sp. 4G1]|nr:hypothetical protein BFR04_07230 [Gaetbulibacter sp. 4G1]